MTLRAVILAGLLAVGAAGAAVAHEHVDVADGRYELTIGWRNEPAYVGEPNGLDLKVVRKGADAHAGHDDHDGHGDLFQSDELGHGDSFEFTFTHDHEGAQAYHDHVSAHHGTVTVSDDATTSGTVTIELHDDGFEPADVTVQPGTTVRWVNERQEVAIVASGEHEGGHGDHAHEDEDVVLHAHENLTVAYEYGGETFEPPQFRPSHGRPGWYTAEITPTRPGVYTLHVQGTIEGHAVDVRVEPHEVEDLSRVSFPEADPPYHELAERVAALEQEIQAQIRNPPPAAERSTNDLPGFGLLAAVGAVAVAFMMARRLR